MLNQLRTQEEDVRKNSVIFNNKTQIPKILILEDFEGMGKASGYKQVDGPCEI